MRRLLITLGVLALFCAGLYYATPAHSEGVRWKPRTPRVTVSTVFTVYLDPAGTDTADGLSPTTAVKTLDRAENVIAAASPTTDVEVRIAPGTYVTTAQTTWTTYLPGHSISFLPTGWNVGDPAPTRPVFESNGHSGYWLWAKHNGYEGDSSLRFYYLELTEYVNGLAITGDWATDPVTDVRVPDGPGLNNNLVSGLKIHHIGTTWNPNGPGYAAIKLENSSNNVIKNTHVQYAENPPATQNLIHAFYLAHGSSDNQVYSNAVKYVSGHPMNVRNVSNRNDIHDNTFTRTGWAGAAYFSEWFCDSTNGCYGSPAHPDNPRECASDQNLFHHNSLVSGYDPLDDYIPAWVLNPAGSSYAGGLDCSLEGSRLSTYGNTRP